MYWEVFSCSLVPLQWLVTAAFMFPEIQSNFLIKWSSKVPWLKLYLGSQNLSSDEIFQICYMYLITSFAFDNGGGGLVAKSCPTFVTPWTVACQAPLSMRFSLGPLEKRIQEYWSGLPFPSPVDLPNPGIKPRSPALLADSQLSYKGSF